MTERSGLLGGFDFDWLGPIITESHAVPDENRTEWLIGRLVSEVELHRAVTMAADRFVGFDERMRSGETRYFLYGMELREALSKATGKSYLD